MSEALRLASQALGRTSPNPLVGAIIVKDGEIIGRGYHHKAGTPHAEVHALAEAGDKAAGATAYVSLEPCSHFGRTPPCSQALIRAGVKKVVVAMEDPNPLVSGTGINQLRAAGIEVELGDMEQEARSLNEVFIKYITTRLPFVVYKTAMSLDGKISTSAGESRWITGPDTRQWVHSLRNRYDGIMVGINTVLADDPELTCRLPGGRDPVRLVVDSKLRLPLGARIIKSSRTAPLLVATTTQAPSGKISSLEEAGARVLVYDEPQVPLKEFLLDLPKFEITGILLEGGSTVAWSMLEAGLVDKVHFCLAPKLIGGADAPGPLGGRGVAKLAEALDLRNLQPERCGDDIIITGYMGTG